MFVCLALTIKMWHSIRDKLTDNWVRVDLLYTPCYGTVMKQHQYLHILSYLHFTYDRIERDRTDENFDRPKKITRPIWNSKYHIFQILQPFQKSGYWWSYCFLQREGDFHTVHNEEMEVFQHKNLQTLWTDWINVWHEIIPGEGQTAQSTALDSNSCDSDSTDEADRTWPQIIHGQFLSSPELFDDLTKKQIYCCGSVRPNRRGMPQDLALKTTKLKRGDIYIRTRADFMAILWQDKRDICVLMNIHHAPVKGNFFNMGWKAIKLQIVMVYNHHIGYVDKGDRMANSYSISHHTFKWMKKFFFHLLETWSFSIATFFIPHVGVRKFHIEIFSLASWGICWHMLDQNGEYQGH